jgi:hypothetical protein
VLLLPTEQLPHCHVHLTAYSNAAAGAGKDLRFSAFAAPGPAGS